MDINIQNRKIELIQWITTLNDSSIIEKLLKVRESESKDWWSEISEEEKQSIKKGVEEADNGSLNPHSEARALYEKWL